MKPLHFFLLPFMICCIIPASLSAKCIGSVPVHGTGSTWEDCAPDKPKDDPPLTTNSGPGSGENNINIFPNNPPSSQDNADQNKTSDDYSVARHQARIELTSWVIPGADHFDKPGMPEKFFFNGAAWEYYINKTLGFGILLQQFSKTGGRDFKDISYTDSSGDSHIIASPGSLERLQYTAYIPYVCLFHRISERWGAGFRFGIGRVEAEAEYKGSSGMGNAKYDDNTAMLLDGFLEYILGDVKVGAFVRYITSNNDSDDYLEYIDMGSAQVGLSAQWMLRDLGLY